MVEHQSTEYRTQSLTIKFMRTIRVPDNTDDSKLPPGLGEFRLFKTLDFAAKLPADMTAQHGVFFAMHQHEAMWVDFKANHPFMIKMYAGGINVVSGEHSVETIETKMRRLNLIGEGKSIQDYVVVPGQMWIDGFAVAPGVVRQFVATPLGMGYSVEAQLTGQETVGGLQFEITPSLPVRRRVSISYRAWQSSINRCYRPTSDDNPSDGYSVEVKTFTGKTIYINCSCSDTVDTFMECICDMEDIPVDQQRLLFQGRQMERGRSNSPLYTTFY